MKRKIILLSVIILSIFLSTNVLAQSPKKILKRANKALGGERNLKAIKSSQRSGIITRMKDGAKGEFKMQASQPNFYNSQFDIRGFETEVGFNGKSGWIRDSREGLRTFTGKVSDDFKAEVIHRNWRWINYKKRKEKLASGGTAMINGRKTNVVILTDRKAVRIKMYFDAATNLLIREEIPAGDLVRIYDYSDYRPVQKVKEPFKIMTQIGNAKFEIKLDQVAHNRRIAQSNFDFPKIAGEPLPDIQKLLKEVGENEDRVEKILEDYSYTQKTTKRELKKDGILRVKGSETYQLSFYKGYRIRRLVAKNGKPLTPSQQRSEDKAVEKRVKKIERKIKKQQEKTVSQNTSGTPDDEGRRISIAEVLKASKLTNPRRERLQGRNVIVFDFEPNPDFDTKKAKSFLKFFGKTAGVMWIDEKDKQVARLEAVLFESYKVGGGVLAKLRKGASFMLEQKRINDEIWLPSLADVNLSIRVLLLGGVKVNQMVESFDYRKFKTEVEDAKVKDLEKQN